MGVKSDGSYGVDAGLFYSFPVTVSSTAGGDRVGRGGYSIVHGLDLDTDTISHIVQTTRRLGAELDEALAVDNEMPPIVFDDVVSASPAAESDNAPLTA